MYKALTILLNDSAKDEKVVVFALTAIGDFFSSGNDLSAVAVSISLADIENGNKIVK